MRFWRPVIRPSRGPGPRLAIRYNPPPKPVIKTPKAASINLRSIFSKVGRYGKRNSSTNAIMITLKIVPIPGICFRGIQQIKTKQLTKNVATPMLNPVTFVIP